MSGEISLLLAGDALLTRPWSHVRDADFIGLIEEIRDADVAIANLETVIHEFKGHAQANSGGTYSGFPSAHCHRAEMGRLDGDGEQRGRPKLTSAELAERIVAAVAAKSKKLGAQVRYDRRSNRGEVVLEA